MNLERLTPKGESDREKLDKLVMGIRDISGNNKNVTSIVLVACEGNGTTFVQGSAENLHILFATAAQKDSEFASIIKMVAHEISRDQLDDKMPEGLKDELMKDSQPTFEQSIDENSAMSRLDKMGEDTSDSEIDNLIDDLVAKIKKDGKL